MTKQQFLIEHGYKSHIIYDFKKKFPQFLENNVFNYKKMSELIYYREDIRERVRNILANDKKPKDIIEFFDGKNKSVKACNWKNSIFLDPIRPRIVDKRIIDRCILILEKFKDEECI